MNNLSQTQLSPVSTEADAKKIVTARKNNIYKEIVPMATGMFADNTKVSKERMIATVHRSILGLDKKGQLRPINDLKLFFAQAGQYGLNPFKKEIYATYVWDSSRGREELTPIVSIHGLRKLCRKGSMPTYTHTGVAVIELDDEGKIVSATVPVFGYFKPGEIVEITRFTAYYDEFVRKKKDGTITKMWREKPRLMLTKCSEANGLRQGFDISGLYIEEEISNETVIEGEVVENDE